MFNLDLTTIGMLAGLSALIYFVIVPKVGNVRENVEHRRERAVDLAAWAEVNGLPLFKDLFLKYSIGNYPGVFNAIDQLSTVISNDGQAKASIDLFLKTQFDKAISTKEGREQLLSLVESKFDITIDRQAVALLSQKKQPLEAKTTS